MANTIDLTFLGTSSAQPSVTRSHSSLAVRINGTIWMFDAGEGIQRQLMYSTLKLGKINKVFITHLHGDHIYGLPGLVCTLTGALNPQNHTDGEPNGEGEGGEGGNDDGEGIDCLTPKDPVSTPCLDIYGPEGLRYYLRCALMFTYSRLPIYYRVHELVMPEQDRKEFKEDTDKEKQPFFEAREHFKQQFQPDILHPDELMGENIQADSDGYFRDLLQAEDRCENIIIENSDSSASDSDTSHGSGSGGSGSGNESASKRDRKAKLRMKEKRKKKMMKTAILQNKVRISACYIKHSVPTIGYVIEEHDLSGNIKMDLVQPPLLRNKEALLKERGIKQPLSLIRDLKRGFKVHLPDGTVLDPDQVITPTEQRKLVILGDTYNPSKIIPLADRPTILVHEATNMYEGDESNTEEAEKYRQKVMGRGHSTPEMAGAFAKRIKANTLILNHFSSRYSSLNHIMMVQPQWENDLVMRSQVEKKIQECQAQARQQEQLKRPVLPPPPFPVNYPKRELMSAKEKKMAQEKYMKTTVTINGTGEGTGTGVDVGGAGSTATTTAGGSTATFYLQPCQQKYLKDWETMEKIRSKAASTFDPASPERIILADDYLQVECNRQRQNSMKRKKNESEGEGEGEDHTGSNASDTVADANGKKDGGKKKEGDTAFNIPIYMAWNQHLK